MELRTKQLTLGEELRIEIDRSAWRNKFNRLAAACARVTPGARSTYAGLLELTAPPTTRAARTRLYVLCVALGLNPHDYGVGAADRMWGWPSDDEIRTEIAKYAPRDSNPEPAEQGLLDAA